MIMRKRNCSALLIPVLFWILLVTSSSPRVAFSGEPFYRFTHELRERGYGDTALDYLKELEKRTDLPKEIAEQLPMERALSLLSYSRQVKSATDKTRLLDRAISELNRFLAGVSEEHPLAGRANSELAAILVGKGQIEVIQSNSPLNADDRSSYQESARKYFQEARTILETAVKQHQATYDKFPTFIASSQPELLEARDQARENLIRAQLGVAKTHYEEAQAWDRQTPQFFDHLNKAIAGFKELFDHYRTHAIGIRAHLWMGKCYEEQDEIGKALGIYQDLIDHPGTSEALVQLQNIAWHFRLICLNHEKRSDHRLVIKEADEWQEKNKRYARTQSGLGIQWEQVQAHYQLGLNVDLPLTVLDFIDQTYTMIGSEERTSRGEQEEHFEKALEGAQTISFSPGRFQEPARTMIQQLEVLLNRIGEDPKTFASASGRARNLLRKISKRREEIQNEKDPATRESLNKELESLLNDASHVLRIAMLLAGAEQDPSEVYEVKYNLSYVYFLQGKDYESAVLGSHLAHRVPKDEAVALNAAYLSMGAYVTSYNIANKDDRDFELNHIIEICELISTNWPESERANDARMQLGNLYRLQNEPAKAADWYMKISEASPDYADAQVAAGQAYLASYQTQSVIPNTDTQMLEEWLKKSEEHLRTGLTEWSKQIPEDSEPPEDLIKAKLSLVQILINNALGSKSYEEARQLLLDGGHAIIPAVQVDDEANRPQQGVKEREFASLAYQMLLRTYVGEGDIDKALESMSHLEKIADAGDPTAILFVYEQLGRQLQKEIQRLKELNDANRLNKLRQSFDTFLSKLYQRKESLQYGSLLWIAQTYYSLGEGMESGSVTNEADMAQASQYFQQAADSYDSILAKAATTPNFLVPEQIPGVKLLLVKSRRKGRDFEHAYQLVHEILSEDSYRLDAQFEAAQVLQDWASSQQGESYKKYLEAIGSRVDPTEENSSPIWGWAGIALKLKQLIDAGRGTEDHVEKRLDARFHLYECQHLYAMNLTGKERDVELTKAKQGLYTFALTHGKIPEHWQDPMNDLYAKIQTDLGEPVQRLPEYEPPRLTVDEPKKSTGELDEEAEKEAKAQEALSRKFAKKREQGLSPIAIGVVIILGLLMVIGTYFMMAKPKRRVRVSRTTSEPQFSSKTASKTSGRKRKSSTKSTRKKS